MLNRLQRIMKLGWVINEMRFDHNENRWYFAATHVGTDISINANGHDFAETAGDLCNEALAETPQWFRDQLKAQYSFS
jgi:hypothetical protein